MWGIRSRFTPSAAGFTPSTQSSAPAASSPAPPASMNPIQRTDVLAGAPRSSADEARAPAAKAVRSKAPGVRVGVACFARGVVAIVCRPAMWPFALPSVVVTGALAAYLADVGGTWLAMQSPGADESPRALLASLREHWTTGWLVPAIGASLLVACLVQSLTAFALDSVARTELGRDPLHFESPSGSIFRTIDTAFAALVVTLPMLTVLGLVAAAVPRAWPLTTALALLVAGVTLVWNFVDFMMWHREMGCAARLRWMAAHAGLVLGFAVPCALALVVPGAALFLLPVGVAGATRLMLQEDAKRRATR